MTGAARRWPGLSRAFSARELTTQVVFALLLGSLLGWLWPDAGRRLAVLATLFIRLVLMIIAPLIFSTLVVGIAGSGELRKLGGMALRALIYFFVVTAVVMALGFGLGHLLEPGLGLEPPAIRVEAPAPPPDSFWVRLIPTSVVDAMARGDVLQIVVFSVLFAAALAAVGERGKPVLDFCRSLADVMFKLTDYVMRAAPVGVLGAAAALVAEQGLAVGQSYLRLTAVAYLGYALVFLGLFPLLCLWFRIPLAGFFGAIKEPFAIAFATTSSAAALPRALETMEAFGVPRRVVAFVLPTGYSFNLAGSALYIGVSAMFVAQAFRLELTLSQAMALFGTLYVVSKGIATIPRGSLIAFAAALASFGLPAEQVGAAFALLLAIDPILDMPRTGVNVTGNCLASALVARWQGNFGKQ